ncbi:MAG: VanZ family protein [Anaerolineae bacterium]|nr:VanZ family protein [Anaerolineae bacterium]
MFEAVIPNASRAAWSVAALVLIVYGITCLVHLSAGGRNHLLRSLLMYAFWLFGLIIAVLIVLPLPEISPDFCAIYRRASTPQTVPFRFVRDIARASGIHYQISLRAIVGNFSFLQAFTNVGAFIPLGIYLRGFSRRSLLTATLAGFALSLSFEVVQGTGIFGLYPCPYRQFDVDDLILNTSGTLIGYVAMAVVGVFVGRPTRP